MRCDNPKKKQTTHNSKAKTKGKTRGYMDARLPSAAEGFEKRASEVGFTEANEEFGLERYSIQSELHPNGERVLSITAPIMLFFSYTLTDTANCC